MVLDPIDELVPETDPPRVAPLRCCAKHRFKSQLGHVRRRRGAVEGVLGSQGGTAEGVRLGYGDSVEVAVTSQRCDPLDLSEGVRRRAECVHLVSDPVLAEDLHGALIEVMRLRKP